MAYLSTEETFAKCYTKQVKLKAGERFIHVSVILYISMYVNTCILGRTYFIERSIHLIEED